MAPSRRLRMLFAVLAAAASLAVGACGEDAEQRLNEGARDAEEAGRDAGKAGEEAARDAEEGAEDAQDDLGY